MRLNENGDIFLPFPPLFLSVFSGGFGNFYTSDGYGGNYSHSQVDWWGNQASSPHLIHPFSLLSFIFLPSLLPRSLCMLFKYLYSVIQRSFIPFHSQLVFPSKMFGPFHFYSSVHPYLSKLQTSERGLVLKGFL